MKPIYAHNVIIHVNCFTDVLKLEVIKLCNIIKAHDDRPMCVDIHADAYIVVYAINDEQLISNRKTHTRML